MSIIYKDSEYEWIIIDNRIVNKERNDVYINIILLYTFWIYLIVHYVCVDQDFDIFNFFYDYHVVDVIKDLINSLYILITICHVKAVDIND